MLSIFPFLLLLLLLLLLSEIKTTRSERLYPPAASEIQSDLEKDYKLSTADIDKVYDAVEDFAISHRGTLKSDRIPRPRSSAAILS